MGSANVKNEGLSIPSNWDEKAGLSSRWETELEPIEVKKKYEFVCSGDFCGLEMHCAYLTETAARAAPRRPGARQEPASPVVRSTKTWSFERESSLVERAVQGGGGSGEADDPSGRGDLFNPAKRVSIMFPGHKM